MKIKLNICWFRRDLRLKDNAALYHALKDGLPVLPVFIFDRTILDKLGNKADKRVEFIHYAIVVMQDQLERVGSTMTVAYGWPQQVFADLFDLYDVEKIFTNGDYEPDAIERDTAVGELAKGNGTIFLSYKDQVIFEKGEVMKDDGGAYSVFTPYSKRWRALLADFYLKAYPTSSYFSNLYKQARRPVPGLEDMGFQRTYAEFPASHPGKEVFEQYADQRDFPAVDGTSRLGVHLRFGTISIRGLAGYARGLSDKFLSELIWRDFYQMILWNFPWTGCGKAFKKEYDSIEWRNNEEEFARWCEGRTGYPIVDAGMRELNATGYMHNRVRMITASFLSKHLLIDWRWGEAYFAEKLLDFDLASNNGGWQWAAGCGCDAAPYFRIFNPYLQTIKFDPQLKYIRRWVPEFEGFGYDNPIVDHDFARKRCLDVYGKALSAGGR